jgi:hypothetical protein
LLIEKAASGLSVAQELQRLYATDGIAVYLISPKGDKVARCHAIVPILSQGLVYSPNISWSGDLLLPELANFPYGKHDDLVDSTTMALSPCEGTTGWPHWIHEIKHDGFRILARKNGDRVRLITRNGYDFADRFPKIVEAMASLPVQSCFIDGEAIVVDENGLSVFDLIRYRQHDSTAVLCAFDLIELDGEDLRQTPIEERKHALANVLFRERDGIAFNRHYDGNGAIIFKHACALGCEGIVSKRVGSPYRSGRVSDWIKVKNPAAPAVKRGEGLGP